MGHWLHGDTTILEFVPPPRRRGAEGLERRLRRLERELEGFPFDAVNIPEIREEESRSAGGERVSPFEPRFSGPEIAAEIGRRFGLPTIVNHVVTARPRRDLILWLREAHERHGVENFVLVGPARRTDPRPGPPVPEANEIAKGILPTSVRIGNICIPGRISAEVEESERMEGKARGGVDFFTSQILYRATPFIDLLRALAERSPLWEWVEASSDEESDGEGWEDVDDAAAPPTPPYRRACTTIHYHTLLCTTMHYYALPCTTMHSV